jgi:hypothetical protein
LAVKEVRVRANESTGQTLIATNVDPSSMTDVERRQIDGLIHLVFSSKKEGRGGSAVFADLDDGCDGSAFVRLVAERLADVAREKTCLVSNADESFRSLRQSDTVSGNESQGGDAIRLDRNLWFLPIAEILEGSERGKVPSAEKILHLRGQFAYTVIHAPPLARSDHACLLARPTSGLVLLLHAQKSRRQTALAATARIEAAGARLLGTVLLGRRFPIPAGLYQRV